MSEPIYFKQLEIGPMQNYVYLFGDPRRARPPSSTRRGTSTRIVAGRPRRGRLPHHARTSSPTSTPTTWAASSMGHQITGAARARRQACRRRSYIHKAEVPFVHRV